MDGKDLSHTLFRQAPDAVIFADTEGVIASWNAAAQRLFGFSEAEAIGQSLDIIVPERFREAHWTGYRRALAAGDTKYSGQALPTRSERKGGEDDLREADVRHSPRLLRHGDRSPGARQGHHRAPGTGTTSAPPGG